MIIFNFSNLFKIVMLLNAECKHTWFLKNQNASIQQAVYYLEEITSAEEHCFPIQIDMPYLQMCSIHLFSKTYKCNL